MNPLKPKSKEEIESKLTYDVETLVKAIDCGAYEYADRIVEKINVEHYVHELEQELVYNTQELEDCEMGIINCAGILNNRNRLVKTKIKPLFECENEGDDLFGGNCDIKTEIVAINKHGEQVGGFTRYDDVMYDLSFEEIKSYARRLWMGYHAKKPKFKMRVEYLKKLLK